MALVLAPGALRTPLHSLRRRLKREHLAILLALLGTHSFVGRSTAEEILRNPLVLERIVRGALAAAALVLILPLLIRRLRTYPKAGPGIAALALYVIVAGASVLYSAAAFVTAAKVFELGVGFLIIWALALTPERPGEALRGAVRFVISLEAALIATAVLGFFLLPGTFSAIQDRPGFLGPATLVSPYSHSNGLSASGSLVAAYALALFLNYDKARERRKWGILAAAGTLGTLLASGRQGLVIWVVATAALLWVHRRQLFALFLGPVTALLVALNWSFIWQVLTRSQPASTLSTWSGRRVWWSNAVEVWKDHPWTGYGFGAGGRFIAQAQIGRTTSSLHSGYIEALVGVGLVGLVPLAIAVLRMVIWCVDRLVRATDTQHAILFVPLLLHSLVSLGFGGWLTEDFLLLGALVALADVEPVRLRLLVPARSHAEGVRPFQVAG